MRRFEMRSFEGEKVAEGCVFSDNTTAVRWMRAGYPASSVWWDHFESAEYIHAGVGAWRIVFVD